METSHPVQRGITLTYDDTAWDIDTSSTQRAAPNFAGGLTGGIGHNLPQEAPREFAQAVLDVARL